jgi:cytochrome bd-type quinol oxidase subunit 1
MPHSLPYFYAGLLKVKAVEIVNRGEAMKDFVKGALVLGAVLALVSGVRFAVFGHLHSEAMSVKDPAPIAAADRGCAVRQVKFPCLQHTD